MLARSRPSTIAELSVAVSQELSTSGAERYVCTSLEWIQDPKETVDAIVQQALAAQGMHLGI